MNISNVESVIENFPGSQFFDLLIEKSVDIDKSNNKISHLVTIYDFLKSFSLSNIQMVTDISPILLKFLQFYKDNEQSYDTAILIIHQVLHTINELNTNAFTCGQNIIDEVLNDLQNIDDRKTLTKAVLCIRYYVKYFDKEQLYIRKLWRAIKPSAINCLQNLKKNKIFVTVLIHMFDDLNEYDPHLIRDEAVTDLVLNLLDSDKRDDRKIGLYLLNVTIKWFSENISRWIPIDNKHYAQAWQTYLAIMESLEEEQSYLILPSLQKLDLARKSSFIEDKYFTTLYLRLLKHSNTLVTRWSLNYFLSTFTCSDLKENVLELIMQVSNKNQLYNYEGYFLSHVHIEHFLKGDIEHLYPILGNINWESIPLYVWMKEIRKICTHRDSKSQISYPYLITFAGRIRLLRNYNIRQRVIELLNEQFQNEINDMTLTKYIKFVETLYNTTDKYKEYTMLFNKLRYPTDINSNDKLFTKYFYEIFRNNINEIYDNLSNYYNFFNNFLPNKLEWLRFTIFYIPDVINNNETNVCFGLDVSSLKNRTLDMVIEEFLKHLILDASDKSQFYEVNLVAIYYYFRNIVVDWNQIDAKIFEKIFTFDLPNNILQILCEKLEDISKSKNPEVIETIIRLVQSSKCEHSKSTLIETAINNLLKNNSAIHQLYIEQFALNYPAIILDIYFRSKMKWFTITDVKNILHMNFDRGEKRIIASFEYYQFHKWSHQAALTRIWLETIKQYPSKYSVKEILNYHKEIKNRKSRYFENSFSHRLKFRIACGLCLLMHLESGTDQVLDEIWDIILNETNQLNVTLIYEYVLCFSEYRIDILRKRLEEMSSMSPNCQVSVIVIIGHCFLRLHTFLDEDDFFKLIPFMTGKNFQTRLYAQLFLYKSIHIHNITVLRTNNTFREGIDGRFAKCLYEIRIHFQEYTVFDILHNIINLTCVPFDECYFTSEDTSINKEILDYTSALKASKDTISVQCLEVNQTNEDCLRLLQKSHPNMKLLEETELICYPAKKNESEMIVVASLVDKIPNLGGIARTCEVLGIRNLVLNSRIDILSSEFINLSMTAENFLNIEEVKVINIEDFLVEKQKFGYKIIGAEQTTDSLKIQQFQFPKKCILLLGHEKYGIPPPLLNILDYVIEIPQFGQVRSLNVHITAAIFMWEYCKTHLLKN